MGMARRRGEFGRQRAKEDITIVAFTAVEYLCVENDKKIELLLRRQGLMDSEFKVHWCTFNETLPRECYKKQEGIVHFKPGNKEISLSIDILDNPSWNVEGRCCMPFPQVAQETSEKDCVGVFFFFSGA
jgi:hypothetical protein